MENKYLDRLNPCPECGNDDIKWCNISVRPYCDCGYWGATNFGDTVDAINQWNKPTEHQLLLELKDIHAETLKQLECARNDIELLNKEIAALKKQYADKLEADNA